jgi:hypothetical protein
MPMRLKLDFECDVARVCRSGGQSVRTETLSIELSPTVESLGEGLKRLPDGWSRTDDGYLACRGCTNGPIRL